MSGDNDLIVSTVSAAASSHPKSPTAATFKPSRSEFVSGPDSSNFVSSSIEGSNVSEVPAAEDPVLFEGNNVSFLAFPGKAPPAKALDAGNNVSFLAFPGKAPPAK